MCRIIDEYSLDFRNCSEIEPTNMYELLEQGLGEELAKQFSAHGAYLILSSRKMDRLQACLLPAFASASAFVR